MKMWKNGWCVARTLLILVIPALLFGCGDRGPKRVVVSGTATYKGKPIPEGMIRFVPMNASETSVSGASIVDGKYKVDGRGGIPVGTHKIEIEAHHPQQSRRAEGGARSRASSFAGNQYIPEKYNVRTQLQIAVDPDSGEIIKNFDLND